MLLFYNPNNFGRNNDNCGIKVMISIKIIKATKYGIKYLNTDSTRTPPTLAPTNNALPTGGVILPIHKLKAIMIPK